ncbi:MFS transporter [Thalassospira tepidiphila]|uniref:Major facilitator transporter n=2 Tax=Thalassospira tepidiphila TaxID=393657 RepID=A0A853KW34_9PROT|nr:MFS transporter [Thalassospira tepidiphila]NJB76114.1 MFS family permease [Thalassospira tepidiphila]OAZ08202.1 major facilitator transporter [Thalassospira tepidiphila MCCC 1A03514]
MIQVLTSVWALLIGVVLIMLGNGMHFTLIGLRGGIEGFSSAELAIVTSGYFAGFLSGARITPRMIKRVGHVRVFAALGSFTSAGLIAFPLIAEPWAWTALRVILGFCMSGIYVTAESWLNDASTNETRGKVLSAYMIAQTLGIIGAQGLLTLGDAANSALFIVASILVSISFAPILLSASSVPVTEAARPMGLKELFAGSPLSTVGIFLLGCVYATQTGMAAVYGTQIEMTTVQIATFVAMLFAGALVFQYPIGWLSDRMDRRKLIFGAAAVAMSACMLGWLSGNQLVFMMCAAFVAGGMTTPLYALFLAYTNDFLSLEEMPAASGGLVLTFGVGAILGPLIAGWSMEHLGPQSFWLVLAGTFAVIAVYALYRMTRREALPVEETESYVSVLPTASPMAVETAGVWAAEQAEAAAEEAAAEEAAAEEAEAKAEAEAEKAEAVEGKAPKA